MDLKINIQEDKELRAFVKDLIAGQVRAIIRDDIKSIVAKEFSGTIKASLEKRFQAILDDELRNDIHKVLIGSSYKIISPESPISKAMMVCVDKHVETYLKTLITDRGIEAKIIETLEKKISKDEIIKFLVEKMVQDKKGKK